MIRVKNIELSFEHNSLEDIIDACSKKLKINSKKIKNLRINKESLDARKKPDLKYVYEVDIEVDNEIDLLKYNKELIKTPILEYDFNGTGTMEMQYRPVIVGAGPAGLFCAYMLASKGFKPIIIERGEDVDSRMETVTKFWETGVLNKESNVQFGEGGAGTFSDGKLNTQVKGPMNRARKVLQVFNECGADDKILYQNKPHIGTDQLRIVVKNMRNKIIQMGGEFKYNTCLTDILIEDKKVKGIMLNNKEELSCDVLVLAIGHSARDTFKLLYDNNISMEAKPFAVGIRIQHNQQMIDYSQYGYKNHSLLEPASYKLTYKAQNGRGVYSFCMCPGGFVVNSSSEDKMLAINGMSNNDRGSDNANSAIIVTITPRDYGDSPLDGIEFQRNLESKAYELGHSHIPVQLFKDYKNNIISKEFKEVKPIFKGGYEFANINEIFPDYINEALKEGIDSFGRKIKGFDKDDAIIAAVESRTSSPVRINRNEEGISNVDGLYPCGEGAGYAGGITSAAMDGIKVFEFIASKYKNV